MFYGENTEDKSLVTEDKSLVRQVLTYPSPTHSATQPVVLDGRTVGTRKLAESCRDDNSHLLFHQSQANLLRILGNLHDGVRRLCSAGTGDASASAAIENHCGWLRGEVGKWGSEEVMDD